MDYIFWEFREKSEEKSEIFELYHLNSEHTPRTQCFNAPKMNYTLPEQTEVPKQTLWTVPFLSDIPDSGFSLKQALMQRRTSWNFSADPLTDQELETYIEEGQYFVLGDNGEASIDSRDFGVISENQLLGKAIAF